MDVDSVLTLQTLFDREAGAVLVLETVPGPTGVASRMAPGE
jgi:hypothetical protein